MSRRARSIDLSDIERLDHAALRALWLELFGTEPPKGRAGALMRLEIAWAAQARTQGDLDPASKRLLRTHARALEKSRSIAGTRSMPVGSTLVREWRGRTYTVTVAREGFLYEGRAHSTLTGVAREITGLHRSGPHFFGLVKASA